MKSAARTTGQPLVDASLAIAILATLATGGCSYVLVSPPARMVNLESAKTAAPGETVVGARAAGYTAIFNPAVALGSVGVRRGVEEGIEVSADATYARVYYDGYPDIDRDIFAARVGGKIANQGGSAALAGGVGAGFAPAAGGFGAVDVAGIVSYPNCYLVPFGDASLFASVPVGAKQVDFRNPDGTLAASVRADLTYGFGLGVGLEIPLDHDRCRQGLTPARIQIGLNLASLIRADPVRVTQTTSYDGNTSTTVSESDRYGALGLGVGVEFPF
jgi:hypothetical protein